MGWKENLIPAEFRNKEAAMRDTQHDALEAHRPPKVSTTREEASGRSPAVRFEEGKDDEGRPTIVTKRSAT